jgi:hypothetical protein
MTGKRLFVVMVGDATNEQLNAYAEKLKGMPFGFWHHAQNGWLIVDLQGQLTAGKIRDDLRALMPGVTTLVLRVNVFDWASMAPTGGNSWLTQYLDPSDFS